MEKINIAQLLKDCPKGMELDCAILDNVVFEKIDFSSSHHPIIIRRTDSNKTIHLTKYGQYSTEEDYKCIIFPKGKTTWEGFVPPCKFKDGDIIFTHADSLKIGLDNTWISIFKENSANGVITYAGIKEDGSGYYDNTDEEKGLLCSYNDIVSQSFATEEEKQKLFDAIKANGYHWNDVTKTLEKLPKFKVGNKIKYINGKNKDGVKEGIILSITNDTYDVAVTNDMGIFVPIAEQDDWELVPNKFDINTLKPFDKVLVRDSDKKYWSINFFGFYNEITEQFHCSGNTEIGWDECIPYENNQHLLSTTDICDDFYKTWE